jgi:hypothetical protein
MDSDTSESGTEHGWDECPMHGEYRDDEKMCPDCWDNAKVMGGGEWDA